jgi:hypothetical protein
MRALPVDESVLARRAKIAAPLRACAARAGRRPDDLTAYRALPMVVVLPESVAQLSAGEDSDDHQASGSGTS